MFSQDEIDANPTAYSFTIGAGYKYIGAPRLPVSPLGPPSACEPSTPADPGSWHRIIPPNQPDAVYVRAQWNPAKKIWRPPLEMQGRRVGYTSAYLAACGWTYGEAD